ncbi:hypothetical protein [Aquimarina mytili]|uniref:YhhN-like protein n=1 Tax=Aquimarina mytili TaxID=874423 RepID=A0A937DAB9_9FLAO|nr:hypothetical protein [Aquimarina mytili]MBL0682526.1 hypothetical protein [Aquimarina mytili]
MNGEKLLKLVISFLVVVQVLGFVFKNSLLYLCANAILPALIALIYFISTKRIKLFHVVVLLALLFNKWIVFFIENNLMKSLIIGRIMVYVLLFYFLYYNHKSFKYNSRDVFTLVLGSSLYTVIFFMAYLSLKEQMGELHVIGFLNLLLIYILLIVGAMHYINIQSEKSLWFFLSMLNFAFSDFMLLLDTFYLQSYELEVLLLICEPLAILFLVNYMVTKSLKLKSEEFEGF